MAKPIVLIIDDELGLLKAVRERLSLENFDTVTCTTAEQALLAVEKLVPDIMIVDIRLPGMSGLDFCRKVRSLEGEVSSVPLLFLTTANDETSKILGLELGGDDYITKPYSPNELVARVRALLRRSGAEAQSNKEETLESGRLVINKTAHTVSLGGKELDMPPKMFDLLWLLLKKRGRVLTRFFLMESVWGKDYVSNTRTIDTHIKELRKILEAKAKCIKTVEGLGYKWEED